MNLGSPIELILLAIFIGSGAYLGEQYLGGYVGSALGGVVGVFVRIALGLLTYLLDPWPACSCGNGDERRFDFVKRAPDRYVWKCEQCGRCYERQRRKWFEVQEDDVRVLKMRQGFLGAWHSVSKE